MVKFQLYVQSVISLFQADNVRDAAEKGTLTKRPRTKRPMYLLSQKFCNETSLGQNSSPWTKHPRPICDKTFPFSGTDCSTIPENKTNFFGPTKNTHFDFSHIFYCTRSVVPVYNTIITFFVRLRLPCCSPWQSGPGGAGPAPSGTGKCCGSGSDRFLMAIRLHKKIRGQFGKFCEKNSGTDLSVHIGNDCQKNFIYKKGSVLSKRAKCPLNFWDILSFLSKKSGTDCPSQRDILS
jgi:hypothetical protein